LGLKIQALKVAVTAALRRTDFASVAKLGAQLTELQQLHRRQKARSLTRSVAVALKQHDYSSVAKMGLELKLLKEQGEPSLQRQYDDARVRGHPLPVAIAPAPAAAPTRASLHAPTPPRPSSPPTLTRRERADAAAEQHTEAAARAAARQAAARARAVLSGDALDVSGRHHGVTAGDVTAPAPAPAGGALTSQAEPMAAVAWWMADSDGSKTPTRTGVGGKGKGGQKGVKKGGRGDQGGTEGSALGKFLQAQAEGGGGGAAGGSTEGPLAATPANVVVAVTHRGGGGGGGGDGAGAGAGGEGEWLATKTPEGRRYYLNAATMESSWGRPVGYCQVGS
jgi:hypothetical protein